MAIRTLPITIIASILGLTAPAFAEDVHLVPPVERSGGCDDWGCGLNGPSLDGVAAEVVRADATPQRSGGCDDWGCGSNGPSLDGVAARRQAPRVEAIVLPGGERIAFQ